jgi:hypothetical protein
MVLGKLFIGLMGPPQMKVKNGWELLIKYGKRFFFSNPPFRSKFLFSLNHYWLVVSNIFSIIYGIILPIDFYLSRWLKPPTRFNPQFYCRGFSKQLPSTPGGVQGGTP